MAKSHWRHAVLYSSLAAALAGCGTVPEKIATPAPVADVPASTPESGPVPALRLEPASRSGNPDSYVVFGRRYRVKETSEGYRERGVASWYGKDFHGRKTSSGPLYNMFDLTAAHKSLPIPTYVRVTNLENGRDVVVKVNDRGPFVGQRIIDLSYTAANRLGMLGKGTARVEVVALEPYQVLPKLAARRAKDNRQLAGLPSRFEGIGAPASQVVREGQKTAASAPAPADEAATRVETTAAPLSSTTISAQAETPQRPAVMPASPATRSASWQASQVEQTPPAASEPTRSEPLAVRAEPSRQPSSPASKTRPKAEATGDPPLARQSPPAVDAPVDVPAPRLSATPAEGRAGNARTKDASRSRRAEQARAPSRPAVTSKETLVRLVGVKLSRSRNLGD